jgi:hypothetical protein
LGYDDLLHEERGSDDASVVSIRRPHLFTVPDDRFHGE